MQKKLFFFHTFALVTAMAILLAVNSGVLHVVMGYYQKRAIPAADERSQQVQSVLDGWDENSRDWDTLEERLRAADYDLVVCQDGEIVSTSLDQGQQDFFSRLTENASWPADGTLVVQDSGVVLVGRQMGDYLLVAMPHFGQPDGPRGLCGPPPPGGGDAYLRLCQRPGGHRGHLAVQRGLCPVSAAADHAPVNALTARGQAGGAGGPVHAGGLSGPGRVYLGVRRL